MSSPSSSSSSSATSPASAAFQQFQATGNPRHLGVVFDETASELLRLASHLVPDLATAEDLVQATYLTAIERRDDYQPKGEVLSWLFAILTNLARMKHRVDARKLTIDGDALRRSEPRDPREAAEEAELSEAVAEAIAKLPETYQPVINLHLRHGLSARQISLSLKRPPGTVRTQLVRGLALLRQLLPASFVAGVTVLTTPVQGLAAIREVVLAKAASAQAAAAKSSLLSSLFTANKPTTILLGTGTLLFAAFGITLFVTSNHHNLPHEATLLATTIASSPTSTSVNQNSFAESASTTADSSNQHSLPSPPHTVAHPSSPTLDPRRIPTMNAKTLASFSSPQPSAVQVPVPVRTLSTLVLSTTLLFPALLPSQSPIYSFKGENAVDLLGISVSTSSDVNQDGYPDLLAGAPFWDDTNLGGFSHGRLYLYSGKDGTLLLTYQGEQAGTNLGFSVSQAQDVNLDGYADLLAGANSWDDLNLGTSTTHGRMYVISGKDASLLFAANGENTNDFLGQSVSPASDVNLDGYPDLLAGAYGWADTNLGGTSYGRLYLYSGKDGTWLLTYPGEQAGTNLGYSVNQAQDVNQDGYPDLVAGAPDWDDLNLGISTTHGRMYVISGKDASILFIANGVNSGDRLGQSVSTASDVNQDGYPDLLAGAPFWSDTNLGGFSHGRMYLYSGKDGTLLLTYQGEQAGTSLGFSVSQAQDVNFDGYPDLVAGANSWDDLNLGISTTHGRMYVISGKDASLLFTANGKNTGDQLGYSVSPASDVNQDGYPDLLAGSRGWNGSTGRVCLYSGTPLPLTSDEHLLSISQASTQNLSLSAGPSHAGRQYWVFGNFAVNGTSPGVTLGSVNIPLNPDPWTQVTIDFANTAALFMTKGTLDGNGQASASLNSLAPQPAAPLGLTLQHCYLVYQAGPPDAYYMASNLVPWTTVP